MDITASPMRLMKGSSSLNSLPEYIITTFFPQASPLLARYPALFRLLGFILAFYYFGPFARLQALWRQTSSLLVSTITVSSEEDLFQYLTAYVAAKRAIRPNQTLNAITNPLHEQRRHRHDPEYEESARRPRNEERKIQYEQGQGTQIFVSNKRLFWVQRAIGEGHSFTANRHRKNEVLHVSCLGRSVQPIKDMMETVYRHNKDKEKSLTIIRRPYSGGYGSRLSWSRLTAKRRRMLDTVILQESQTAAILADVEEYMSETTKTFYANHGIPYRRGYLFHGPPGCGKTSFCLALASKFNLDVYVLTLLDSDLNDTDLMSLLNQLPTPCLLLLEDIDDAGLSRKRAFTSTSSTTRRRKRAGLPEVPLRSTTNNDDLESDADDDNKPKSNVTLSGLLNAIDGVAAPEGHILIMTTNKPHELDDALVRAGRISVHVGFSNATQKQAAQIFERMYIDLPQQLPVSSGAISESLDLKTLSQEFSDALPEDEFSPADLQDYLLVHKKDPTGAVRSLPRWIEDKYEERKRKEAEKEAEIKWKAKKAENKRRRFREDLKVAMKEGGGDEALEDKSGANVVKEDEEEEGEKEPVKS